MDSLTQAVLGAGIQGALLGRVQGRKALLCGALLATLPDLDVAIRYADPVSAMTHHRGFSHSLPVLTAAAALLTAAVRRWRPSPGYGAGRLFLALWLVLATHPLLDAFTSYGTQLWWPWRPVPAAWSSVFIIDPFFTLPLLAAVLAAAVRGRPRPGWPWRACGWALGWCGLYLALSLGAKAVAEHRVRAALEADGLRPRAVFSTPLPFNVLLWRVVALTGDDRYHEAVAGVFDRGPPERLAQPLGGALAAAGLADSPEHARLRWFSGGWLRYDDAGGQLVVTDLRMGLGVGHYTFRFRMAERDADGRWRAVAPTRWPSERGGAPELRQLWRRVPGTAEPLPLADWAARMAADDRRR
ncbi:MAG: metal-dependent hydrolase [Xylophilus ampelinus]